MIKMRVGNQRPLLGTLGIHPKIHLREINSPILGLDQPIGHLGDFRHLVSLRNLIFPATFHLMLPTSRPK